MKTIYTFTLDGEDYPSEQLRSYLRIFADLVYNFLYNYDVDGITPLNINKNIVRNNIYYSFENKGYYFDSDVFDDGYINYEPFIVGERSFGLTVKDGMVSENDLQMAINQALRMMRLNNMFKVDYTITIKKVSYDSRSDEDEINRRKAICLAYSNLDCEAPLRKFNLGFGKKRVMNRNKLVSTMGVYGK